MQTQRKRERHSRPTKRTSCIACNRRKKRCEGQQPCRACIKRGIACERLTEEYLDAQYQKKRQGKMYGRRSRDDSPSCDPSLEDSDGENSHSHQVETLDVVELPALSLPSQDWRGVSTDLRVLNLVAEIFWKDPFLNLGLTPLRPYVGIDPGGSSLPGDDVQSLGRLAFTYWMAAVTIQAQQNKRDLKISDTYPDELKVLSLSDVTERAERYLVLADANNLSDVSLIYSYLLKMLYSHGEDALQSQKLARFSSIRGRSALAQACWHGQMMGLPHIGLGAPLAREKLLLFWTLYYFDRSFSLAFITPYIYQDQHITAPPPTPPDRFGTPTSDTVLYGRHLFASSITRTLDDLLQMPPQITPDSISEVDGLMGRLIKLQGESDHQHPSPESHSLLTAESLLLLHLEAEAYEAKVALFRPHLVQLLSSGMDGAGARSALFNFCLQAMGLHQRLRVVTPLLHVMSLPMTELLTIALLLMGTNHDDEPGSASYLKYLTFVTDTCAVLYKDRPNSGPIIDHLRRLHRQVEIQSVSPWLIEHFHDIWISHLRGNPLTEMLIRRGSDYWENFIEDLERKRSALGLH